MRRSPMRRIRPEPLTEEAWAPFGWLPLTDTDPRDGQRTLSFEWADPHVNIIGHDLTELEAVPGVLRCRALYRHLTHTQTLMPLDHDAVIAVAPPGAALASEEDLGAIRAFVLRPLQALVLERGTWHWGPYPVGADSVSLFNVQGRRYAEDNDMADLAGLGLGVDVEIEAAVESPVGAVAGR